MVNGVANQVSLFDLVMDAAPYVASNFVLPNLISSKNEEILNNYLYQGERILSLLREKKTESLRFLPCDFLERFNISTYIEKKSVGMEVAYVEQTAVRQARELWERNDSAAVSTNALLEYLSRYLLIYAETENNSEVKGIIDYFFRKAKTQPKGIVAVQSILANDTCYIPAGKSSVLSKSKHLGVYQLRRKREYYRVADAANLFWKALLVCVLKEQVLTSIKSLSEEELNDNILYRYITDRLDKEIHWGMEIAGAMEIKPMIKIGYMFAGKPFVKQVMTKYADILYSVTEKEKASSSLNLDLFLLSWFLSDNEEDKLPFEVMSRLDMLRLCELLEKVCDIYDVEKQSHIMENDLKRESAKVYQTKKNISLKCQKAMLASGFNEYFGYVEIDDECDLEKFCLIEQQFRALSTMFFHGRKDEEVSIRFRKLGRHHAAGLYYPYIKCLAVDVRNADSLSHEYFHMLDYESGRVSSRFAFSKVRERYRLCLLSTLEKEGNEAVKEKLQGTSKYNLAYYLTPTEIFARCGELYLTKIKGISNSLVEPDTRTYFAYPEDEELLELIKDYFGEFLKRI